MTPSDCDRCLHPRALHLEGPCAVAGCNCTAFVSAAETTFADSSDVRDAPALPSAPQRVLERRRLPPERRSTTRVFRLAYVHKDGTPDLMHFYLTAGLYDDGTLGEIFIRADKTGTLASGTLDSLATMVSIGLQYGIPLEAITAKLRHTRYPPNGFTKDAEFPSCSSVGDLIAQWLDARFGMGKS